MDRFYPVSVDVEGRRYNGEWVLRQGGKLCVGGAYGSKTVDLGRAKPENLAPKVLKELVAAWRKKQKA